MAKNLKEKDGTVVDSVSSKVESETEEVVTGKLDPDLVGFAKDFIINFAKEYRKHPQCPAHLLLDVMKDYKLECDADKAHSKMTDEEIMTDASTLIDLSDALFDDFSKNHDQANETIKAIMRTHVPRLQREIDQYEASQQNKKIK